MSKRDFFSRSVDQFGGKLCFISYSLIERLKELKAIEKKGIFRESGSKMKISELSEELNNGPVKDWSKYQDPNVIGDTLKKYFRNISETSPLIPSFIYEPLMHIPDLYKIAPQQSIDKIKKLLDTVTRPTYINLAYLMFFLNEVAQLKDSNMMDSTNLSLMFGPNIMFPERDVENAFLANRDNQNQVTQIMIDHAHEIFVKFQITKDDILKDNEIEKISHIQIIDRDIEDSMLLREIRRSSLIPYVPPSSLMESDFVRPI